MPDAISGAKNSAAPYARLDPNLVLSAVESTGLRCTGNLFGLNSYENRVYQIALENGAFIIAKFYRPARWSNAAILEEHAFAAELAEHEIPVVAPLITAQRTLHEYEDFRFALFPKKSGRTFELDNLEHLAWMGRFLGRLHAVGACRSFAHRLALNVHTYGHGPYDFLRKEQFIPAEIYENFCRTLEALLASIENIFQSFSDVCYIRLHGDCHPGNILWSDAGPHIVDLDDCLMGPAVQDLWMLISGGTEEEIALQLNTILRGYREFHDFDVREIKLIEPLRTLRMINYMGWLAKRWQDPAFLLNFPWFNTAHYWRERLRDLNEQMQKPAFMR